jgi:hypothetical protein
MPTGQDKLQARAIKAGLRAAKKSHHIPSEEELRKLKIQVIPDGLRLIVFVTGLGMLLAGLTGWPIDHQAKQTLLAIGGGLLATSAIFGVRRSIGAVLDAMSAEGASVLLEIIFAAIGDLFGA